MSSIPTRESELEKTVLGPLRRTSMQFYFVLAGLALVVAAGVAITVPCAALSAAWVLRARPTAAVAR